MSKNNTEQREEILTAVNIVVDYHDYQAFKKLVGPQNSSKEIRRMIKERVLAAQKNEKLQDNLKLSKTGNTAANRRPNQSEVMLLV